MIDEFDQNEFPAFDINGNDEDLLNVRNIFEIPVRENEELNDDEDEEDDRRAVDQDDDNDPLYNGAEISKRESMLAILSLCIKHHLTQTSVADLIALIELHCPGRELIKNSLYKFQQYFNLDEEDIKKHFYCPSCAKQLNNSNDVCPMCPGTKNSYFIEMPLVKNLQEMFSRENFFNSLQKRFERPLIDDVITDVYDGELYKTWTTNGFLSSSNNISFSWYTDGIPVFKSSKIGTWPIYLTINELPFDERKKSYNMLLLGLWYGEKKPHFNAFFYAYRDVFKKLYTGVKFTLPRGNEITLKAILLMGVCDLSAKTDCLNFVNFNAKYGCPVCYTEGEILQIGARSHLRVYPYCDNLRLKTSEECERLALQATPDSPQFGIRGSTALSKLMPDFMNRMCIDRMHAVDSGVIKKILTLVLNISYRHEPFSLYESTEMINNRLKVIKPPKFVHRMPKSTNDLIHWKASEMKNFFYYYFIPVFEGIMKIEYFNHCLLLITAIYYLSSDRVTRIMIDQADDLLNKFVREFEQLYGKRFSSINVHLLLHLPNCVRLQGPLWAHDCYAYEDYNGQLLLQIYGTRYIGSPVANGHNHSIKMIKYMETIENEDIRDFCNNKKKQSKITEKVCDDGYSVGCYKTLQEIPNIIINAMNNSRITINNVYMCKFLRLLKKNILYVSEEYTREVKTCTSVVKYIDNNVEKIGKIICFVKYLKCECHRNNCNCEFKYFAVIHQMVKNNFYVVNGNNCMIESSNFFYTASNTNIVQAIEVNNLIAPCIYININNISYIIHPLNVKELE